MPRLMLHELQAAGHSELVDGHADRLEICSHTENWKPWPCGMWWCIFVLQQSCLKILIDGSTSIFFLPELTWTFLLHVLKDKTAIQFASIVYIKSQRHINKIAWRLIHEFCTQSL